MNPGIQASPAPVIGVPQSTVGPRRSVRRIDAATATAAGFLVLITVAAAAAPVLGLPDPDRIQLANSMVSPLTDGHILGTDQLGRDVLSRLVWGARPALLEGVLPVLLATLIGVLIGGLAGFLGGVSEGVAMRTTDALLAIPPVMMGIAVGATLGPGLRNVVIAMMIVLVPPITRVARGAVLEVRSQAYVSAARSVGVREHLVFLRHVLPNALPGVLVYSFSLVGIMIVFAAGLSFIGLGVQPPTADWGRMVNESRLVLTTAPWVATAPGFAIFLVGLSFGLVGEAVDKRVRQR